MPSTAELCLLPWLPSKSFQGRAAALWGHLVAQVAPLVCLKGSPLHKPTACAKHFSCRCDSRRRNTKSVLEVGNTGDKSRPTLLTISLQSSEIISGWVWTSHPFRCPWPAVFGCCLLLLMQESPWTAAQPHRGQGMEALGRCCQEISWGYGLWQLRSNSSPDFTVTSLGTNRKLNLPHV